MKLLSTKRGLYFVVNVKEKHYTKLELTDVQ